ncbi:hypothetical protein POM88_011936 [Heracleum sosnowskyi]|uniref:Uncharacterized protein n=1 Tax=Heracleum sosnowskyi TaxID=360622 RepID=A0AAD8MWX9_9APIA|nr:hypothetical protein POM88_011936 [Heracleum sosnowskyi]
MIRRMCPVAINQDWSMCQVGDILATANSVLTQVASLYLAVAVYLVWKERNFRVHNSTPGHPTMEIIRTMKRMVKEKLFSWLEAVPSEMLLGSDYTRETTLVSVYMFFILCLSFSVYTGLTIKTAANICHLLPESCWKSSSG